MKLIKKLEIKEGQIRVVADPSFTKEYLSDDFCVSYTTDNKTTINKDLATIPFIANVAPIVWLSGLNVTVPALDETFASALDDIKKVYQSLYPDLEWKGSIKPQKLIKTTNNSKKGIAMLFSGGVDSVYTSLYAGSSDQTLITILGADVARSNKKGWDNVKQANTNFANNYDYQNVYIDSNLKSFLNIANLRHKWPSIKLWWADIQHSIGFLGLVAPIVYEKKLLTASTYDAVGFTGTKAATPDLYDAFRWGNVKAEHHGYDVTRQGKINGIIQKTFDDEEKPQLRVCYSDTYGDGKNCARCEKCLRTFAGIVAAGADPHEYGFSIETKKGLRRIKTKFLSNSMAIGPKYIVLWQDIQKQAKTILNSSDSELLRDDARKFLDWFKGFNFERYSRRVYPLHLARETSIRIIKNSPISEKLIRKSVATRNRLTS